LSREVKNGSYFIRASKAGLAVTTYLTDSFGTSWEAPKRNIKFLYSIIPCPIRGLSGSQISFICGELGVKHKKRGSNGTGSSATASFFLLLGNNGIPASVILQLSPACDKPRLMDKDVHAPVRPYP